MASTYTPQQALDIVKMYVRQAPLHNVDYQLCDVVHSRMWKFYPWRWTQSALTAIALVDGQQDYALAAGDAAAFYRLVKLRLVCTSATPDLYYPPMNLRQGLEPDLNSCSYVAMRAAGWEPITSKIRLESAVAVAATETVQIQGEYQRNPAAITPALLDTAFSFPDQYFDVYVEGLKWKCYEFTGDPRAGSAATGRNGRRTYSGQLGVFMDALEDMTADEDYSDEESFAPDTPLGASVDYW